MGRRVILSAGQALRREPITDLPSMRAKSPESPAKAWGPRTSDRKAVHKAHHHPVQRGGLYSSYKTEHHAGDGGAVPCVQAGGCVDPRYNRRLSAFDSCRW